MGGGDPVFGGALGGILPIGCANGQRSADARVWRSSCLAHRRVAGTVRQVAGVLSPEVATLRRSRRPSPCGRSHAGVHGSPTFSMCADDGPSPFAGGRAFADAGDHRRNRFDAALSAAFYARDILCITKGERHTCRISDYTRSDGALPPFWPSLPLARLWHAVTRFPNRRCWGAVPALLQGRLSGAAFLQGLRSALRAMWSIAKPILVGADPLIHKADAGDLPARRKISNRTIGAPCAGGFFVVPREIRRAA